MRFITFNLWHGLSPASPVAFEALEPTARRRLREQLQVETLRALNSDFCFLQEVNPVQQRVLELERALAMKGIFQPDLAGLKVLGVGLPLNLHSGLAILASRAFGLKPVTAVSLSRPFNWVRPWASWQLKEERFALFSESLVPGFGKILLVNTHLHHGLEATFKFIEEFETLAHAHDKELNATFRSELKQRVQRANQRRLSEIEHLLKALKPLERRYSAVVVCGDFNAEPDNEIFHPFKEMGFKDAWAEVKGADPGYTFDPPMNEANHLLQSHFPLTLVLEDLTFSSATKGELLRLVRRHENRPRRIDYLWVRGARVTKAELIGKPNAEGLAPSDHFGVCVDLEVE